MRRDRELFEIERSDDDPALVVDVGGFEGPLDLLLDLARKQKVDLHEVSILALAEQYLVFVETARTMRLELAADYLVMAAWLAYLKSRLLLPEPSKTEHEPSARELASALAARLRHLEAIREAARVLAARPQLGRDVFVRGAPPVPDFAVRTTYDASLYDLLSAYAQQRTRQAAAHVTVARRPVWSLGEARDAVARLLGDAGDWVGLDTYLLRFVVAPELHASALASMLAATLEVVREGRASLRQEAPFAPLMVRRAGLARPELVSS